MKTDPLLWAGFAAAYFVGAGSMPRWPRGMSYFGHWSAALAGADWSLSIGELIGQGVLLAGIGLLDGRPP